MAELDCGLCQEVNAVPKPDRISKKITETDNFVSFVTEGPLTLGHLLITSREHYRSMACIPENQFGELRAMRENLGEMLTSAFHLPQIILFEHGPSKTELRAGSCVDHAHFHIMPVRLPSTRIIRKVRESLGDFKRIDSYRELRKLSGDDDAYVFFEFDGIKYLFDVRKQIPSQFVRQVIGKYLGREYTWDWGVYSRHEDIVETCARLEDGA